MDEIAVPPNVAAALDVEWNLLASPGTWWTAEQRLAFVAAARNSDTPLAASVPSLALDAARRVATDVHSINEESVARLEAAGVTRPAYAEILGVVARLVAVDTFYYGVGAVMRPLPDPRPGAPSELSNPKAGFNGAWVPTEGPPGATSSLTAVPAESEARWDLSRALYVDDHDVGDWEQSTELLRPQMELVAARTSLLNECFY